jgi:hypothetical protein
MRGQLSFEAAEAEPFRPAEGVVLLRPGAAAEVQLQIREAEAGVHLDLPASGAHRRSRHKVLAQRPGFYVLVRVREALAGLPPGVAPHLEPMPQGRESRSRRMSDRSAGRLPLRLKTVH